MLRTTENKQRSEQSHDERSIAACIKDSRLPIVGLHASTTLATFDGNSASQPSSSIYTTCHHDKGAVVPPGGGCVGCQFLGQSSSLVDTEGLEYQSYMAIEWTTIFSNSRTELWQHDVNIRGGANYLGTIYTSPNGINSSNAGSYNYTVGSDLAIRPNTPILITWMFDLNGDGSFPSTSVNLTQASTSPTTSSTATSTTLSPTTSSSAMPTSDSNQTNPSSGIPLAFKVGLGMGIGLGIPLVLIIGGIIGWRIKRRRVNPFPRPWNQKPNPAKLHAPPSYPESTGNHENRAQKVFHDQLNTQGGYLPSQQPVYEIASNQRRSELGS
ncbi:hypothetical protein BST61_g1299 [Cercospora zeina]